MADFPELKTRDRVGDAVTEILNMRRLESILLALGMSAVASQAAVVTYSLTGTTEGGLLVVSGSFSFDTATIGANFTPLDDNALPYLTSFNLSISGIPGTPTSTTFSKAADTTTYFLMQTDGDGEITNFSPGFDTPNADGYTLAPAGVNVSTLEDQSFAVSEAISWNYTQVPELSASTIGVGLGLLGLAGVRALRRR